jgi:hypothetical protein
VVTVGATDPVRAGALSAAEIDRSVAWIASLQLPDGMIPWHAGGHADPWNHLEAVMALAAGGRQEEAVRGLEWLSRIQNRDGSWCGYYLAHGVEEPRRDTNVCAYVATAVWWMFELSGDRALLERMWPMVRRAVGFVLAHQLGGGQMVWAVDADGTPGRFALLAGSSSVHLSLRCAAALARASGQAQPGWERAADRLAAAVRRGVGGDGGLFADKSRWAMDWYYPVLAGGVVGAEAHRVLGRSHGSFVTDGWGVRCVKDRQWFTAAETAESAIAYHLAGLGQRASQLLGWTRHLRAEDGSYWTGRLQPGGSTFPRGQKSTYGTAAVVLADHVLGGRSPAAGLFDPGRRDWGRRERGQRAGAGPESRSSRLATAF